MLKNKNPGRVFGRQNQTDETMLSALLAGALALLLTSYLLSLLTQAGFCHPSV